jgi:hypothetical protein
MPTPDQIPSFIRRGMAAQKAADDIIAAENLKPATPPTHTLYTPVWEPEWNEDEGQITAGKFRAWLAVGEAWQDHSGGVIIDMHSQPINRDETATSYFYCVPVGRPPPQPLTITRAEFLEQQFAIGHE